MAIRILHLPVINNLEARYSDTMVYGSGKIPVRYSDPGINTMLAEKRSSPASSVTQHFSHSGEHFLRLPEPILISSFPIHHDTAVSEPSPELRECVSSVVEQLLGHAPELLQSQTHIFDPSDITHPTFLRFFRVDDQTYALIVRVSLEYDPRRDELVERTNNTRTATFRTNELFVEMDLVPLKSAEREGGRVTAVTIEQSVSETWIGETGRGYMRSGIWLDRDLSLFFSKLFTTPDVRSYPYQIFTCKYRAVAHSAYYLKADQLKRGVPLLHRARSFLIPRMREIESALRSVANNGFSENLPQFRVLRKMVGNNWDSVWKSFSIEAYLNDDDKREFRLNHGIF